jgi:hypothetical protein
MVTYVSKDAGDNRAKHDPVPPETGSASEAAARFLRPAGAFHVAAILDEITTEAGKTFAIVIDEVHSSQGGKGRRPSE